MQSFYELHLIRLVSMGYFRFDIYSALQFVVVNSRVPFPKKFLVYLETLPWLQSCFISNLLNHYRWLGVWEWESTYSCITTSVRECWVMLHSGKRALTVFTTTNRPYACLIIGWRMFAFQYNMTLPKLFGTLPIVPDLTLPDPKCTQTELLYPIMTQIRQILTYFFPWPLTFDLKMQKISGFTSQPNIMRKMVPIGTMVFL